MGMASMSHPHAALHRTDRRTVHVIGGGLAGLAAAAFVARSGVPVVVHEQRNRLGGRSTTDERAGFRFNQGPHALYVGAEATAVLADLDISPTGSVPAARGARMVRGGVSHLAPGGAGSLLQTRLFGARDKVALARLLTRLGKLDPSELASVTVDEWIGQVTDRPVVAEVVQALVRLSTYVNAPGVLTAQVAVQQVQRALSTGVLYLDGGWERLVGQVADAVIAAGGRIERGEPVTDLPDAPAVIVATGGPTLASSLTDHVFVTGPPAEAAVLDLALTAPAPRRFVIGVDEPIYLSDHSGPNDMTPTGRASVSLAQYLSPNGEPGAEPNRERLRSFARHSGITADQVLDERYLHRMATVTAIATAEHGGLRGRSPVSVPDQPGVFVAGDWVGPSGHLVDAALHSAREAARLAVAQLERKVTV